MMNYDLGEYFESFIRSQIQHGRYATESEVIRAGLRALEDAEESRSSSANSSRYEPQRRTVAPFEFSELSEPLVLHMEQYVAFIKAQGVGTKDAVASSPASYVSYLRSVAKLIGAAISPEVLRTERDVQSIAGRIRGKRAANTINNYCSAMRQYVAMVTAKQL